jgi:hypothetical protein
MKEMEELEANMVDTVETSDAIESQFNLASSDIADICSKSNIEIKNNIENIRVPDMNVCDDDYDMGL